MTDSAGDHEHGNDRYRRGVLVTGASRGLGAEVARAFANFCGDRVAVHYRGSRAEAEAVCETLEGPTAVSLTPLPTVRARQPSTQ